MPFPGVLLFLVFGFRVPYKTWSFIFLYLCLFPVCFFMFNPWSNNLLESNVQIVVPINLHYSLLQSPNPTFACMSPLSSYLSLHTHESLAKSFGWSGTPSNPSIPWYCLKLPHQKKKYHKIFLLIYSIKFQILYHLFLELYAIILPCHFWVQFSKYNWIPLALCEIHREWCLVLYHWSYNWDGKDWRILEFIDYEFKWWDFRLYKINYAW